MLDALKPMILEASRRCKKPSQIQKFVFKNYGYNVSREHIASTLLESTGLRKAKTNRFVHYFLPRVRRCPDTVNVLELDLCDDDLESICTETGSVTVSVGGTTVELQSEHLADKIVYLLQEAGVQL